MLRRALAGWRRRTGRTSADLARRVGIGASHLSLVQKGKRRWALEVALAVSLETDIPVQKLVGPSQYQIVRSFVADPQRAARLCA